MREILFRGKATANKEWVEGLVCYNIYDELCIQPEDRKTLGHGCRVIDPETVGQYTGRVDKNGNRVFEGDIIRITAFAPNIFVGAVLWDDHDQCYLIVKDPSEQIYIDDFGNYGRPSYYEVIGNIYDNPELLEVE